MSMLPLNPPTRLPALTVPARLGLFYATMFAVGGVHQPFWPVWLSAHGQSAAEITALLAAGVCIRLAANPLIAGIADRRGERRRPMIWMAWSSLAAFSFFTLTGDFGWLFVISLLFGACWAPIGPLGDNLALLTVYADKLDYGRIRVWGSISFMACTALAGWLLTGHSADRVWLLVMLALVLTAFACHLLPDRRIAVADRHAPAPTRQLLRAPLFVLFLAGSSLIQASHAAYYGLFAVHMRGVGYPEKTIGLLWSEGVVAEIVLFLVSGALFRRFTPPQMLLLGAAAGLVRWPATAETSALAPLILLQLLHALTFGAAHLGAMHFISRAIPPRLSASAQSLYSALTGGVALGIALLCVGPLYEQVGVRAFHAMGLMALVGGLCCLVLARRWDGAQIVADPQ